MRENATSRTRVWYEEPERRKPPIMEVGPLAWVHRNLFGSGLDTALTLLGALLIIGVTVSFLQWSIQSANWLAVTFNLRLLLIGRVEGFLEGRLLLLALLLALLVGVNLAAWTRVRPRIWAALAGLALLLFLLPLVIFAATPATPTILAAGQREVVSGSITTAPLAQVGFLGAAGERVQLQVMTPVADEALAGLHGFSDIMSDTVRNAADNRLEAGARQAELERLLAGDRLTGRQREALGSELERLDIPPPVSESWAINVHPVALRVLDGATLRPLAEGELRPGEALSLELPASGWYVLEKAVPGDDESVSLLRAEGIYPLVERSFIRSGTEEAPAGRVFQYVRVTDSLLIEGGRPVLEGEDLPMTGIIEHQYKGLGSFSDWLRLMLAPLMSQVNRAWALLLAFTLAGYVVARELDRRRSTEERPRSESRRLATWLWAALPVLAFLLIAGLGAEGPLRASDPQLWGGFLLTMMLTAVGIGAAFPIGIGLALGRRSSLPVVRVFSTLYIEVVRGVPLITVLFMSLLLLPLAIPDLAGPDSAPYRVMVAVTLFSAAYLAENVRGGLQSLPPGQEEAGKALGLSAWQITRSITLPQALRAVIPALVGQFISLYKDTSLVAIVGLIDLTGVTNSIAGQTEFLGVRREPYIFISVIYFVFSYIMSIVSRRIEASGSGAMRA